jgi:formylglycine-generating enzyme required for sulfatase activity
MVAVDTFCIDQFEASLVLLSDGSSFSPYLNPGSTGVRAVSVSGAVPQGYINELQAGDACSNAGKRLCTDAEWLRACQGPSTTTYPYGNTEQPGVCNDQRALHPAIEYFGTSDPSIYSMLDNACLNQLPETVTPSGSMPACVSPEGPYDMAGNLFEWTSDPAGTFRGGSYVDSKLNGPGCLYTTTAHNTAYWDYSTGFRCCAGP